MERWFTSDTHFGHKLAMKFRGFSSTEEMDEKLIEFWNNSVGPKDHVYHLGDFSFLTAAHRNAVARRLKGKMFFLAGNHDRKAPLKTRDYVVDVLPQLTERVFYDQKIVMCHYPFVTWNRSGKGSWMLHGHCHNLLQPHQCMFCKNTPIETAKRMDVGVDTCHPMGIGERILRPYSFVEIQAMMKSRGFVRINGVPENHPEV